MSNKSSVAQMQREPSASRWAKTPFYFNSAEHLLRIERERANTLGELLGAIKTCTDASIFQHTFRTLQEHHFIQEGYSNDLRIGRSLHATRMAWQNGCRASMSANSLPFKRSASD